MQKVNALKKLYSLAKRRVKEMCGKTYFAFYLFGIPLFIVTKRDMYHYNIFLFFIPAFQVVNGPKIYSIDLLLFTWLFKSIKYLFTGWRYINEPETMRLTFCGKILYEEKKVKPYDFPSTRFRDKQVI